MIARFEEKSLYFYLLVLLRIFAAVYSPISDCDETFNYWEPCSYVLFGKGFQTWEYSPDFTIRSYSYILPHVFIGLVGRFFALDKIFGRHALFYFIRLVLGLVSVYTEHTFVSVIFDIYSPLTARLTLMFLLSSPGMFTASVAFLPSSFAMYLVILSNTLFMQQFEFGSLVAMASACIFGWPFAAFSGVMLAVGMLHEQGFYWFLKRTVFIGLLFSGLVILIDSHYFHKYTLAPLNIILYNIHFTGDDGGQNLYGVESWNFLIKNLLLNFNIAFPLSLLPPLICSFHTNLLFLPYIFTLTVFSAMAHKEERFLFIIYPFIAFCAAIVLSNHRSKSIMSKAFQSLIQPLVMIYTLFAMSRICCLIEGYNGPLKLYHKYSTDYDRPDTNLCVGKEWYRFPSSLFTEHSTVHWLKSSFDGQLPVYFKPENGTWQNGGPFNEMNEEEMSRYSPIDVCDYIVDLDFEDQAEEHYLLRPEFEILERVPFLNAAKTRAPYRWLYIPILWDYSKVYHFGSYQLLRRIPVADSCSAESETCDATPNQ